MVWDEAHGTPNNYHPENQEADRHHGRVQSEYGSLDLEVVHRVEEVHKGTGELLQQQRGPDHQKKILPEKQQCDTQEEDVVNHHEVIYWSCDCEAPDHVVDAIRGEIYVQKPTPWINRADDETPLVP